MDDAFRSFVLGLGILLGLVEGGENPALAARLHRDDSAILLSVEVTDYVSASMRKLVDSGNGVSLLISVQKDGAEYFKAARTIRKKADPPVFSIAEQDGKVLETENEEAAYLLLGRFTGLVIDEPGRFASYFTADKQVLRIAASVSLHVEGASDDEAAVLWNYKKPSRVFSLRSVTEVPF
jgi:hypothetical protein